MNNREERDKIFSKQLAEEVAQNKDTIANILDKSKVGQCGGKCRGFKEDDLCKLCPDCLKVLEAESDKIFSASPRLRLFGDVMNTKD